jgi:hypothetical protein
VQLAENGTYVLGESHLGARGRFDCDHRLRKLSATPPASAQIATGPTHEEHRHAILWLTPSPGKTVQQN